MLQLLFGFSGRARRLHWWLVRLGSWVVLFVIAMVVVLLLQAIFPETAYGGLEASAPASAIWAIVFFALFVASIWIDLAITVKRWHDRDKSGWWFLISFVPLVGPIWTFIECGCLDGTQGPNQYGPSPKGIGGDVSDVAGVFS